MPAPHQHIEQQLEQFAKSIADNDAGASEGAGITDFAAAAQAILESVPSEHKAMVWGRLQCIQRDAGLIPGDDESCPSSD